MNSMKYFGADIVSAGMVTPPDDSYEIVSEKHGDTYKKVVLKDGMVVGMVFAGNIEKAGVVFGLMKDKIRVDGFRQALVAEDLNLAALPEEIWRARLDVPSSGWPSLATPAEQSEDTVMAE